MWPPPPTSTPKTAVWVPLKTLPITAHDHFMEGRRILLEDTKAKEAFRHFKTAALMGHTRAQSCVSHMLENGDGVPKDLTRSRFWLEQSAERGYPPAMNRLAIKILQSKPKRSLTDETRALQILMSAADKGSLAASVNIGRMFEERSPATIGLTSKHLSLIQVDDGYISFKDETMKIAALWYQYASDQGHIIGRYHLARFYENGIFYTQDKKRAEKLYRSISHRLAAARVAVRRLAGLEDFAVPEPRFAIYER